MFLNLRNFRGFLHIFFLFLIFAILIAAGCKGDSAQMKSKNSNAAKTESQEKIQVSDQDDRKTMDPLQEKDPEIDADVLVLHDIRQHWYLIP